MWLGKWCEYWDHHCVVGCQNPCIFYNSLNVALHRIGSCQAQECVYNRAHIRVPTASRFLTLLLSNTSQDPPPPPPSVQRSP